jgi:hypothetical protein
MNALTDITGHCLCGAVNLSAQVKNHDVDACHCSMCRRWTSGPLLVISVDGAIRFEGVENIGVYKSSEWGWRAFCKICGTSLYWHMSGTDHYAVSAGMLDDPSKLVFTTEIFVDEKPAYYAFANDTKKMTGEEVVAAFAAADNEGKGQNV